MEIPDDEPKWIATNLLGARDNNTSMMKEEKFEEAKLLFWQTIHAVLPNPSDRADSYCKNWVYFYYYPFDIGMTFPFYDLVKDVLLTLHVAPGQLMPFSWKMLACLDVIESKHHLKIDAEVVKCCYFLKKFSGCRFGFVNRKKDEPLILKNDVVNDGKWKLDYFFFNKASIEKDGSYQLDRWNPEC